MIYIKLIDHFWELDESWQFTGTETRLYFYLLKISYSQGWECCMRSDAKISSDIGVSAKIFKSARGRLVEADLIEYLQGNGRGNKSGYLIKGIPKGRQNLPTFSLNSDSTKENKEIPPIPPKENKENTTTHYKEKEKIIKKEKETAGGDSMGNLFPSTETTANRGRVKPKIEPPSYDEVLLYFQERIENQDDAKNMAIRFYEHFRSLGWRTSSGGKIEYWDSKANLWIIDHYDYDRRRTETIRANPKTESGTHKESTQHSQGVGNDTGTSKDYNQTF